MGSHADVLRSLILELERFGRQVKSIAASNVAQIEKASDHVDDSHKQLQPRKTTSQKQRLVLAEGFCLAQSAELSR
jgi:hypothetical protein